MEIENDFFKKLSIRHNDAHSSEETNKTYSEDFDYFKFSKKSHLKFFRDSYIDYTLLGGELNENTISIYDYQNLLIYSTIKANLSKGAKILEIGSFNSTAKRISRDCELWRLNAPEELLTDFQQGTASMSISRYNDDSVKLKNSLGYFDFIFSNSGLRNIPYDDTGEKYSNVSYNLLKLLKPGGISMLSFISAVLKSGVKINPLFHYLFKNTYPSGKFLIKYIEPASVSTENDLLSYEMNLKDVPFFGNNKLYENVSGKVFSYNVFLKKENAMIPNISLSSSPKYLKKTPAYFFHHLIKCGGSSLGVSLKKWFNFENDLYDMVDGELKYSGNINEFIKFKYNLENLNSDTCIRGHFQRPGYHIHQRYPEIFGRNDIKVFTFVRDPLKVLISLYYFGRKRDLDYQNLALKDYLNTTSNFLSQLIPCNELNYKSVLDRYFFVGIVDRMQESFDVLADLTGKKRVKVPVYNTTKKDKQVEELTPESIAELKKKNELDYKIYNYCIEKFEAVKAGIACFAGLAGLFFARKFIMYIESFI